MMKPRGWALLLIAGNMAFTTVARAQMWGTGMYGGMQGCPYNYGAADGATSDDDEVSELMDLRRDKRQEKRDAERRLRDLDSKKEKYSNAITEGLRNGLGEHVLAHMENGYNCNCGAPPPVIEQPAVIYQPPTVPAEAPPPPIQAPEPPVEPPPAPPAPRPKPRTVPPAAADIFEPQNQSRMPASELPSARVSVSAGTSVGGFAIDAEFDQMIGGQGGFQGGGGGIGGMCGNPGDGITGSRAWAYVCRDGGGVSKEVCRVLPYRAPDSKGQTVNDCIKGIEEYRKVTREADKLRNKISALEDEIANLGVQIGDLRRDRKSDSELEASCPTGECFKHHSRAESHDSNIWGTVLPLAAGVLGGLGAEYLGYTANKANNKNLNKLGWPTMPYQAGSYGFPFFQAGIYGAIAGSTQGGFGCNGGNPYGMAGPFGTMNPYAGNGPFGYGGAFGYPQGMIPGFPSLGGGMYAPGMGPWGMAGPWGNGYNPYGGGGMAGGFAGGLVMGGGLAGGGGFSAPGFAGGFSAPGIGGGFSMPGMAGGFSMPGIGGYAAPGIAGGLTGGFSAPGIAGGFAVAGPGLAGGFSIPGLGGGYAAPGGGMATGFTTPWGVAGGFAGGGFLTPVPGGGYGGMAIQSQLAQYQMQADMQNRAADNYNVQLRTQQGLMSEYNSLMYRMNMVNSGGGGGGYGLGVGGGLGGGLGLGGGFGLGVGLSGGYGGLPTTTGIGINTGVGVGVPGRTR